MGGGGGAITTITTTTPLSLTLGTQHSHVVATQIGKHVPLSQSQGLGDGVATYTENSMIFAH